MGKEDKTNIYLLALVGIVGFVAVVVLIMNVAGTSSDVTGEAYSAKTVQLSSSGLKSWNTEDCTACDDGSLYCGTGAVVCPTKG